MSAAIPWFVTMRGERGGDGYREVIVTVLVLVIVLLAVVVVTKLLGVDVK